MRTKVSNKIFELWWNHRVRKWWEYEALYDKVPEFGEDVDKMWLEREEVEEQKKEEARKVAEQKAAEYRLMNPEPLRG